MAGLGGFNPAPFEFGEAAATDLEAIQKALDDAQGSAIATERGTVAWVENHSTARVLLALYLLARKLGYINDPKRMTVSLARWEAILGISPLSSDTFASRRNRVEAKLGLLAAGTTLTTINDYLTKVLGDMYVGLEFPDPLTSVTYVPGGGSVSGGGPTFLDGNAVPAGISPWASSLAYVAIKLEKPGNMSEVDFYDKAVQIYNDMDNLVGAWMGFDWVRDGPNGAGFYLDEEHNLDNQRFD